jgi:hypothetical protein
MIFNPELVTKGIRANCLVAIADNSGSLFRSADNDRRAEQMTELKP